MTTDNKCSVPVFRDFAYYPCGKTAKSGGLCTRHSPEYIAKRAVKAEEKYKAWRVESEAKTALQKQHKRQLEIYPRLLDFVRYVATVEGPLGLQARGLLTGVDDA